MNDLRQALLDEAGSIRPAQDLADVYRRARRRTRRTSMGLAAGGLVLVGALVTGGLEWTGSGAGKTTIIESPPPATARPGVDSALPGVEITGGNKLGGTLERRYPNAAGGPTAVVLRAADGSFAYHSAVLTFPAEPPGPGSTVSINGRPGTVTGTAITWPLGQSYARVRGDLGLDQLAAVARSVALSTTGQLMVEPPDGLRVVSTGPYWPSVTREDRYSSDAFGETSSLGVGGAALVWASASNAPGGLEDEVLAREVAARVTVEGQPAVVVDSTQSGNAPSQLAGNAELIWISESAVAVATGYSGRTLSPVTVLALQRLAAGVQLMTDSGWHATHPQIIQEPSPPPRA